MPLTHVQLFSIPVSDQDRARDFYVDAVGFELRMDTMMGPDMRWVMLGIPGARTAITLVTWFPTMPAGSLRGLVIETGDLEAGAARLTAAGVEVSDFQQAPWGRYVQFEDPDGNGLILQTSA